MKTPAYSALFALLCLLPSARALTITQTGSVSTIGTQPRTVTDSPVWTYEAFNAALGTLESATLTMRVAGTIQVNGFNDYVTQTGPLGPVTITPAVELIFSGASVDGGLSISSSTTTIRGTETTLQYREGVSFVGNFDEVRTVTTMNPAALARMADLAPPEFPTVIPHKIFGQITANAYAPFEWSVANLTTTYTLDYTYRAAVSAPDGGHAIALLGISCGLLGVIHRRRNRSRPVL